MHIIGAFIAVGYASYLRLRRNLPLTLKLSLALTLAIAGQALGLYFEEGLLDPLFESLPGIGIGVAVIYWLNGAVSEKSVSRSKGVIDDVAVKRLHNGMGRLGILAEETIRQSSGAHSAVKEQSMATETIASAIQAG